MNSVPDAVLAFIANSFLTDNEAQRWARINHTVMDALQRSYRLKEIVSLSHAATTSLLRIGAPVRVIIDDKYTAACQMQLDRLPRTVRTIACEWDVPSDNPDDYEYYDDSDGDDSWADLHLDQMFVDPPNFQYMRLPSWLRTFTFHCDEPVQELQLPPTLTALRFWNCDYPVHMVQLPDGLQHLTLSRHFQKPLSALHLPHSLTSLNLRQYKGTSADLPMLPQSLKLLVLGDSFNSPLDGLTLPLSLESLTFGYEFDQPLTVIDLPISLTELTMGLRFNQPLHSVKWPPALTSLTVNGYWTQSVKELRLPVSLSRLNLFGYIQPLDWISPPLTITSLSLGITWNHHPSMLKLPPSLTAFTFPVAFDYPLDDVKLPSTLRTLVLNKCLQHPLSALCMPANLTSLDLRMYRGSVSDVNWPSGLICLSVGSRCTTAPGLLPNSLVSLHICGDLLVTDVKHWTVPLSRVTLPPQLQRLVLTNLKDCSLSDLKMPEHSLTELILGIDNHLKLDDWNPPETLRKLVFDGQWNQPVNALKLPPGLEVLAFGDQFNQPIDQLQLPQSLTELHLGSSSFHTRFMQPLIELQLPCRLRILSLLSFGRSEVWMGDCDPPPMDLLAPPFYIPLTLRELRVHPHAVQWDRLAQWDLPPDCVVNTNAIHFEWTL